MKKRITLLSVLVVLFVASVLAVSCPPNVDDVTVADAASMTVIFTNDAGEGDSETLAFAITGATIKDVSKVTVSKEAAVTTSNVTVTISGEGSTLSVKFAIGSTVETTDAGKYTITIPETALTVDSTHKYPSEKITKVVTVKVNPAE